MDELEADKQIQKQIMENQGELPATFISARLSKIDNSNKARKARRKGVFISYAPNAPYKEKKFVVELSQQLYEIGLHGDVWFDRDVLQGDLNSPFSITSRLHAAEKCKAVIVVLSESFFLSPETRAEGEIILSRLLTATKDPEDQICPIVFTVKLGSWDKTIEESLASLARNISVNVSVGKISRLSEAEKVSMFISILSQQLEDLSSSFTVRIPKVVEDAQSKGEFRTKPLVSWTVSDVQSWLTSLRIHEKYIISFEEFEIDGFLLNSLTENVLSDVLAVDSHICRRKILQKIKGIIDEEGRTGRFNEWLKQRSVRQRPNLVYLIRDPNDEELGNVLKEDMERKGLKVMTHKRLGQSKDEFLRLNACNIASSSYVVLLLTNAGCCSPFVLYEAVFSIWLGKPLIVAVFENCFDNAKQALLVMLSEFSAVDFATALYLDALDLLLNEVRPQRAMSGVVFEQRYLKHVAEGVCRFREIADRMRGTMNSGRVIATPSPLSSNIGPTFQSLELFVSYQWNHQSKVKAIIQHLQAADITCWSDMDHVSTRPATQSMPRTTPLPMSRVSVQDNLANQIEKRIRNSNAVLLCISPGYLQSSNCMKEVSMAASYRKPIIAILLQWLAWPPDSVSYAVRRIFATVKCTDMSNEKLFLRNMPSLVQQISRINHL